MRKKVNVVFTSHLSLNNWQPSHYTELVLILNKADYQVCLQQTHMPETESCMFRTCYTTVHHDDCKELTKEIFGVNYHDIRKRVRQLLKSDLGEGEP